VLALDGTVTRAADVVLTPAGGERLDILLPAGALEGRVLGSDGQPLGRAVLIVQRRLTSGEWIFVNRNLADDQGRWRAEALAPGLYRALAFDWQGEAGSALSEPVALGDGPQSLDLALLAGGRLRVLATDAAGAPLAGVLVVVRDARGRDWPLSEKPRTGADGVLDLPGVPSGRWEGEARLAGHQPARATVDVVVAGQAEARLVLLRAP